MGVVIAIHPIDVETANGTRVSVTAIDMTSGDPFHGTVEYQPGKTRNARWRSNGNMRDGPVEWNLPMQASEIADLYAVAQRLGAKLT